ncbi:MAG: tetratricopeptide repeat protein, partial [Sedimentisphaerales bacterium]|nr:tetratricopeptide repeat protein [Sedimentisphaerales bacterium]
EKCIALSAANPQIREQAMEFFFRYTDKEKNRRGKKMLESLLAAYPQDSQLQLWQARMLLQDNTAPAFDKAVGILAKVTSENPSIVEGWSLLCQTWLQKGEPARALDAVMRGSIFAPNNKELLLLKARVEAVHTPEFAIPTVKLLHEHDPNDADIAIYLAALYGHRGNYKAAIAVLDDQLTRAAPSQQRKINITRAVALYKNGDTATAQSLFNALAAEDPNDATVMLAKTGLFKDEKKWNEVIEYVAGWYQNHRSDTGVIVAVTKDLSAGQNDDAKKAAEDILRKAMTIQANSPELLNAFAELLYISGRPSEAMSLYEKLIALAPENLTAMNNLAWILCEDIGTPAQSLELAQKGLRIEPEYLDLIDTRGMAYFRLGKLDKATEDFTTCATLYPSHLPSATASYFHLGRAFAVSAKKEEAVKYLRMALESNRKIGGLSASDVTEAKNLLDKILKG